MLLKEILEANEIKRNTYNSLVHRTARNGAYGMPFMKRGLVPGKRGDRYTMTHAVALAAMLEFLKLGIDATEAATVVDAVYDALIDWVAPLAMKEAVPNIAFGDQEIPPDKTWVTISRFKDQGLGWATGDEGADTFSADPPLAKLSINVAGLVKQLHPRVDAIMKRRG